jgi:nucleotide-binding universal stress UspA family protein
MKNVLLLVHDDAGQEARLQAALDLTRALDGHLVCLDVIGLPVVLGGTFGDAGQVMLVQQAEHEREAENRNRLADRLAREGVRWDMRSVTGELANCITAESGLADLLVVNRKLDDAFAPDMRSVASKLAVKSRKPVAAVPESCTGFDAFGTALVAWDGSIPAMAALTAALPLLKLARDVVVVEVTTKGRTPTADEAAAYLSRHGVHAKLVQIEAGTADPAERIKQTCQEEGAEYCVMGAYGHSRLREALFGGVTRRMLTSSDVPLILAH